MTISWHRTDNPLISHLQGAGGSGSFSTKRSPLGGRGLIHSDSTVQMQFHMAEKMEENPRIWQVCKMGYTFDR